ncbi:ATP-binding protein [Streptomyces sp. CB01201]|uniref:ATP-binding protein n=1 Tax=Streptomyces sp. CB01201 TaxID=2020324 RepID=UPI0026CF45E7|nr:ATP-binding protein [Streptomyces sp. CB01201]
MAIGCWHGQQSTREAETHSPDDAEGGGADEQRSTLPIRYRPAAHAAREFVAEALTQWAMTRRLDDIHLCASELVTNALLHGGPAGSLILVRLELHTTHLLLEMHDAGDGTPKQHKAPDTSDDGRGLFLVSAIADDWGVATRQGPVSVCGPSFTTPRRHDADARPLRSPHDVRWPDRLPRDRHLDRHRSGRRHPVLSAARAAASPQPVRDTRDHRAAHARVATSVGLGPATARYRAKAAPAQPDRRRPALRRNCVPQAHTRRQALDLASSAAHPGRPRAGPRRPLTRRLTRRDRRVPRPLHAPATAPLRPHPGE